MKATLCVVHVNMGNTLNHPPLFDVSTGYTSPMKSNRANCETGSAGSRNNHLQSILRALLPVTHKFNYMGMLKTRQGAKLPYNGLGYGPRGSYSLPL